MKLEFQCRKIVDVDRQSLLHLVTLSLQKYNYEIVKNEFFTVSFINDISGGRLVLNTSHYSRVDDGKIELFERDQQSEIVFTFGLSITAGLIQMLIIILFSLCIDYTCLFYSILPISSLLINIQIVRNNFIYNIINS